MTRAAACVRRDRGARHAIPRGPGCPAAERHWRRATWRHDLVPNRIWGSCSQQSQVPRVAPNLLRTLSARLSRRRPRPAGPLHRISSLPGAGGRPSAAGTRPGRQAGVPALAHQLCGVATANAAVSASVPTLTRSASAAMSYPIGDGLAQVLARRSCTLTCSGSPAGRHSAPPFLNSPASNPPRLAAGGRRPGARGSHHCPFGKREVISRTDSGLTASPAGSRRLSRRRSVLARVAHQPGAGDEAGGPQVHRVRVDEGACQVCDRARGGRPGREGQAMPGDGVGGGGFAADRQGRDLDASVGQVPPAGWKARSRGGCRRLGNVAVPAVAGDPRSAPGSRRAGLRPGDV